MRNFINIVEGRLPKGKNKVTPIDTSKIAEEIKIIMRSFLEYPFGLKFDHEWVRQVDAIVAKKAAQHAKDAEDYGEDSVTFDKKEIFREEADKFWSIKRDALISVRRNIEHETEEYQNRAAERHGYEDDLSQWIEDSGWLRGMTAMENCANNIETLYPLSDPKVARSFLAQFSWFVKEWKNASHVDDGGEEPILDSDFVQVVQRLLPLMAAIYSA